VPPYGAAGSGQIFDYRLCFFEVFPKVPGADDRPLEVTLSEKPALAGGSVTFLRLFNVYFLRFFAQFLPAFLSMDEHIVGIFEAASPLLAGFCRICPNRPVQWSFHCKINQTLSGLCARAGPEPDSTVIGSLLNSVVFKLLI